MSNLSTITSETKGFSKNSDTQQNEMLADLGKKEKREKMYLNKKVFALCPTQIDHLKVIATEQQLKRN